MKERVAVGVVAGLLSALLVTVLVYPVVVRGEWPSPLEFAVAAGETLAVGFVLRTRTSERLRTVGFAMLVVGVVVVFGAVAAIWITIRDTGA